MGLLGADDEAECTIEAGHAAILAKLVIPCARCEICGEVFREAIFDFLAYKVPSRLCFCHTGIEESFGPGVVGFGEAIGAVDGNRNVLDLHLRLKSRVGESLNDGVDGEEAMTFGLNEFGDIVVKPEAVKGIAVESNDDNGAASDAAEFIQSFGRILPLVDGENGHGGIDACIIKGDRFGTSINRGREVKRALGTHR